MTTPATRPVPDILFFDVGNVLVSDDPSGLFIYRALFEELGGPAVLSAEEFFERRTRCIAAGGNLWVFAGEQLPPDRLDSFRREVRSRLYARWSEMSPPIPGMEDALGRLAANYRLGICANQPRQVEETLRERGLWDLFEIKGVSESLGHEKPAPAIFEWCLREAGVEPARALMVGDRIDNDIRPAKTLGFQTLWLRLGFEGRGWVPGDRFEDLYDQSARQAYVSEIEPSSPEDEPDLMARTPEDLVTLLEDLKTSNVRS